MSDFGWRTVDRAHRDDDAENGSDDAEAGKRVGNLVQRAERFRRLMMANLRDPVPSPLPDRAG
jgi:hypothetical protein